MTVKVNKTCEHMNDELACSAVLRCRVKVWITRSHRSCCERLFNVQSSRNDHSKRTATEAGNNGAQNTRMINCNRRQVYRVALKKEIAKDGTKQ